MNQLSDPSSSAFGRFPVVCGQHAEEWPQFFALISSAALNSPTGQDGGLIGFIIDAPSYLADYGHPFDPYPPAGPQPGGNAAHGTWRAYEIAVKDRKFETSALSLFMQNIFEALDRTAKAWFFDPVRNRYNMDCQFFFLYYAAGIWRRKYTTCV